MTNASLRWLASLLATLLLASIPASAGWLRASGGQLLDGDQPIVLRGTGGWLRALDAEDLRTMKRWGWNAVRVNVLLEDFTNPSGALDPRSAAWQQLQDVAGWARRADLRVIVALQPPLTVDPAFVDVLPAFWAQVARRAGDDQTIAGYVLLAAPALQDAAGLPTTARDAALREAIASVRAVDTHRLILIEGTRSAFEADNLAYSISLTPRPGMPATREGSSDVCYPSLAPGEFIGEVAVGWLEGTGSGWREVTTGEWSATGDAVFLGIEAVASQAPARVHFDEFRIEENGQTRLLANGGFEGEGGWLFRGTAIEDPAWRVTTDARQAGERGAEIGREPYTATLTSQDRIRVRTGSLYRGRVWVRPLAAGGRYGVRLHAYRADRYDAAAVRKEIGEALRWATSRQVPLIVGEWGIPTSAPAEDVRAYLEDALAALDGQAVSWFYATWREAQAGGSGALYRSAGTNVRTDRSARTVARDEVRVAFFSALGRRAVSVPDVDTGSFSSR